MEEHTITVPELTAAVRTCIGTPFHHGGRVKGAGVDCGGMMIVALRDLGYTVFDKQHYNRADGLKDMVEILAANNFYQKDSTARSDVEAGDLVLVRSSLIYHHLVYYTEDGTVIHALVSTGINKVVETVMRPDWWTNIHSIWRFDRLRG